MQQMHIVQKDKRPNVYGFSVDKGDEVVIGLYYRQCGCKESTYELLNEKGYAFIYSNWVIISKFAMVQSNHKLRGGKIVYNLIHSSLE